jgi:hypothetical protein
LFFAAALKQIAKSDIIIYSHINLASLMWLPYFFSPEKKPFVSPMEGKYGRTYTPPSK